MTSVFLFPWHSEIFARVSVLSDVDRSASPTVRSTAQVKCNHFDIGNDVIELKIPPLWPCVLQEFGTGESKGNSTFPNVRVLGHDNYWKVTQPA